VTRAADPKSEVARILEETTAADRSMLSRL
jgi:hypothetical protein